MMSWWMLSCCWTADRDWTLKRHGSSSVGDRSKPVSSSLVETGISPPQKAFFVALWAILVEFLVFFCFFPFFFYILFFMRPDLTWVLESLKGMVSLGLIFTRWPFGGPLSTTACRMVLSYPVVKGIRICRYPHEPTLVDGMFQYWTWLIFSCFPTKIRIQKKNGSILNPNLCRSFQNEDPSESLKKTCRIFHLNL